MSEPGSRVAAAVALAVGLVLVGLSTVQTIAVLWVVGVSSVHKEDTGGEESPGDSLDAEIDAGMEDPILAADDPLLRERKVLLYHDVNSRTAKDISARLMYLDALDPGKPIDLYISTQGGWSDNAFTIIDTMRTISAPVNTWAVGGCYSSGVLILAAATGTRHATEDAVLMIHANLEDSKDPDSSEHLERERYERVYREWARLPADWYPMTGNRERYLSPKQALAFHLVDDIVPVWNRQDARERRSTSAAGERAAPRPVRKRR